MSETVKAGGREFALDNIATAAIDADGDLVLQVMEDGQLGWHEVVLPLGAVLWHFVDIKARMAVRDGRARDFMASMDGVRISRDMMGVRPPTEGDAVEGPPGPRQWHHATSRGPAVMFPRQGVAMHWSEIKAVRDTGLIRTRPSCAPRVRERVFHIVGPGPASQDGIVEVTAPAEADPWEFIARIYAEAARAEEWSAQA